MAAKVKHADHDYIVARQEKYLAAYRSGSPKAMMEWMDPQDLIYSDFGGKRTDMKHEEVHRLFERTFKEFYDLKIKTVALNGHRDFTAWEWEITCRPALDKDGKRVERDEAEPRKLKGCTLVWWNERDKIVRNHDYVQEVEHEEI